MTNKELRKMAMGFRSGLLGSRASNSMCYAVSAALEGFMSFCGIECRLTEGSVGDWIHFWITLPDGRILDPTADQFPSKTGKIMPKVYLGKRPEHYVVNL